MFQYLKMISSVLFFLILSSCGGFKMPLVPTVDLPEQKAYSDIIPEAIRNYKTILSEFATFHDIEKLHFCFYSDIENLSGMPGLPPQLIDEGINTLQKFDPFTGTWLEKELFLEIPVKGKPQYSHAITGGVTCFDKNMHELKVKFDFMGEAGSTDSDADYQDYEKISKISMILHFSDPRLSVVNESIDGSVDITKIGKGYSLGFYIKGNGVGVRVSHGKYHSVKNSIKLLFAHIFTEFLKETFNKNYPEINKPYSKIDIKSDSRYVYVRNSDIQNRPFIKDRSLRFIWRQYYKGHQSYANQIGYQMSFLIDNPAEYEIYRTFCLKKALINPYASLVNLTILDEKSHFIIASGNYHRKEAFSHDSHSPDYGKEQFKKSTMTNKIPSQLGVDLDEYRKANAKGKTK